MNVVICILVVAGIGVAAYFVAKYMVKNEILDTKKTTFDQLKKIEKYARGTVKDTADISYQQVVNEVDQFLKGAKVFPEYLDRIRAEIMGDTTMTADVDISAHIQKAEQAQKQCVYAKQQLNSYAEGLYKMKSYTADMLKRKKLLELWGIRKEQKNFKNQFDALVSRSEQGHAAAEKAKADMRMYNQQCGQAAQSVRQRLQEWQKRQFDFSVKIILHGNVYFHEGHPDEFLMRLCDMTYLGGNADVDLTSSRVVFLAYQKVQVITQPDGTQFDKIIPGLSVLQVHKDGSTDVLLQEVDKGSQSTFIDPLLRQKIQITIY